MKICFIGMGSIGKRHLKNLSVILESQNITYEIDALRSNKSELDSDIKELIGNEYFDYNSLPNDYDIIFITNPTYVHYEAINYVINKTKHLFIEKPIFDTCVYNIANMKEDITSVYYVACPLRYSSVIKYLEKAIENENIYSVRSICSSYLPDWRSGVDYRKVYSADKLLGGGVSLDLIHELDYITYLFGMPTQIYNMSGKFSDLEINSEDISIYIARYKDKLVELHLDYFGKKTTRQLELYSKDYVIYSDLLNCTVTYSGNINKVIQLEKEDMYMNEMKEFLQMIYNGKNNHNNIQHAYQVLKLAVDGV